MLKLYFAVDAWGQEGALPVAGVLRAAFSLLSCGVMIPICIGFIKGR